MKLCRFELKSAPGDIRSGIVYSGKVYETDGANAIAVHEAEQIRPLSPVGQPPTVRIFRCIPGLIESDEMPAYFYGSSTALTGASPIVPIPDFTNEVDFEPYVACVIAADAANVPVEEADDLILGYTLLNIIVARDVERHEKRVGAGPGRSHDIAIPIGPVLTTPDEMEDAVQSAEKGRRFKLEAVVRVNGVEKRRGNVAELPFTFAEAISSASQFSHLRTGDLIAIGPIAQGTSSPDEGNSYLSPDDEVQLAVEHLGTLAFRVG